jgi:hypothetical protein
MSFMYFYNKKEPYLANEENKSHEVQVTSLRSQNLIMADDTRQVS